MAQQLTNIYQITDATQWRQFIGYVNENQQFVGFPLALIMYEATHCHFCREALPLLNDLAGKYKGIIHVASVDIDNMIVAGSPLAPGEANGKTMIEGISGTPQFFMYRLGKVVDHIEGKDNDRLKKMFEYWSQHRP